MRLPLGAAVLVVALAPPPAPAEDAVQDLGAFFRGFRSTLVVRDVAAGRTVRHDPARGAARTSPCSTFKIPNSLIGLETRVIPDASFVLPWDGVLPPEEEWNCDHDLRSAMKQSVVWYYQELARRVGRALGAHGARLARVVGGVGREGGRASSCYAARIEGRGLGHWSAGRWPRKALAALGVLPAR